MFSNEIYENIKKRRIKLTITYIGTAYHGWQYQPKYDTVYSKLSQALAIVLGEKVELSGCSRTDLGVHAEGYIAHFDTANPIKLYNLPLAVNLNLPSDISVINAEQAADDFHSRFSAISKTYIYKLYVSSTRSPFLDINYTQLYKQPDIELMKLAAAKLIGEYDFTAFSASGSNIVGTVRKINYIDIIQVSNQIFIKINGNSFLYNMVRIIVGTLIAIGQGKKEIGIIDQMLLSGNRKLGGKTMAAKGLTLLEVFY